MAADGDRRVLVQSGRRDGDRLTCRAVLAGAVLAVAVILAATSVAVFGSHGGEAGSDTVFGAMLSKKEKDGGSEDSEKKSESSDADSGYDSGSSEDSDSGGSIGPTGSASADSGTGGATSSSNSEAGSTSVPTDGGTATVRMKCTKEVFDEVSLTAAVDAAGPNDVVCYRGGAGGQGTQSGGDGNTNNGSVQVISGRGDTVKVTDGASLTSALSAAKPGQTIEMADGTYSGKFVINTAGQQGNPITLKGSRKTVLNGGDTGSGYTLHLNGADYWQLVGFSVTGGQKGIMADKTNHSVLSGLDVGNTGQEAVHLLNFSTSNVVQNSVIHDTGKGDPQFGEGLYFGTAKSNWAKKSGGKPDKSDNNKAIANTFKNTTAENIDVKEETSGGVISGNSFDGSGVSGANFADSVLDLKGVGYQVVNNVTTGASDKLKDGFQTHVITEPATSGCDNTFQNNTFNVQLNGGQQIALDKKCGGSDSGGDAESTSESKGKDDKNADGGKND